MIFYIFTIIELKDKTENNTRSQLIIKIYPASFVYYHFFND